MDRKVRTWGKTIWEDKIKDQNAEFVIFGWAATKTEINKQTSLVLNLMEKKVFPLLREKARILDAGVGPMARFSIEFARQGFRVVGLDISPTTLKLSKKRVKESGVGGIELKAGDISKFIDTQKYSLIFCMETFFHIPQHLGLLALRNFNQMLNMKGLVLVELSIHNEKTVRNILRDLIYFSAYKLLRRFVRSSHTTTTVSFYTEDEFLDMVHKTGFKLLKKFDRKYTMRDEMWLLQKYKNVKWL